MSSSSSLSSSFSSSAASSLLPTAPPSNSSQSDIIASDHSASSFLHSSSRHPPVSFVPSSSNKGGIMGQVYSRVQRPEPSQQSPLPTKAMLLSGTAASTGFKLKRAFVGRKKKSEDFSSLSSQSRRNKGKDKDYATDVESSSASTPRHHGAKQLSISLASHVFSKKRSAQPISPDSPLPPPPPPKPIGLQPPRRPMQINTDVKIDNRGSVLVTSPSINAALDYMRSGEEQKDTKGKVSSQERISENERADLKDLWRKSDSAMSHHTIRPGAMVGTRTPRPVSMAESLQSTHTVVPVNKRLSALVTDAEFAMLEEDMNSPEIEPNSAPLSTAVKTSPSASLKSKNRRSMSLNLGPSFYSKYRPPPADVDSKASPSRSVSDGLHLVPSPARDTPTLTRTDANGFISPIRSSNNPPQSTASNIKGRLAALASPTHGLSTSSPLSSSSPGISSPERPQYLTPLQPQRRPPSQLKAQTQPPTLRQTAISISGFAPAAGLAKRAVERMGRAWGGMGSSSSSSGYSSSSSTGTAPSSYSSHEDKAGRRSSEHSTSSFPTSSPAHFGKGKMRRTPNAPSGAWSIASSGTGTTSSLSDSDAYVVSPGPSLGKCLRGPQQLTAGGIVFGKNLKTCVRETAVGVNCSERDAELAKTGLDKFGDVNLKSRMLPAIVVRCAQHLLTWGVQEEGLFRVNGRPYHVSKIRSEFDTGADYDLSACAPGDLDPHAVSSIFKAYLRELPEPILTHTLMPYFDAAMSAENSVATAHETPQVPRLGMRGPGLPSGPKAGAPLQVRKPPSLSTLAMPNFSGLRPPSESLLNALASLISRLPPENRDLIRTVTELIKATAKHTKETKMPLSNLLLVFCPSLNMSPPLLRVLCEAHGIWDGLREPKLIISTNERELVEIRPESVIFDIRAPSPLAREAVVVDDSEPVPVTAIPDTKEEPRSHQSHPSDISRPMEVERKMSLPNFTHIPSEGRRPEGIRPLPRPLPRIPVSTLYMDADDRSVSSNPASMVSISNSSDKTSLRDDESCISITASERVSLSSPHLPSSPPPDLSSSAESLATPSSSGSFPHMPIPNGPFSKPTSSPPPSPIIADSTDLPLPSTPQRPTIGGPIQFPCGSIPSTPISHRKSIPFLSLPGTPTKSDSAPASPVSPRRLKKPSLRLLFSKRSASPLSPGVSISAPSPYLQSNLAASASSSFMSSPISAVTAPQSSTFALPPRIDTPIDSSRLLVDENESSHGQQVEGDMTPGTSSSDHTITHIPRKQSHILSASVSSIPCEIPVVEHHRSPSTSVLSLTKTEPLNLRGKPSATSNPIRPLELPDDGGSAEESWARSVLMAADVDGVWNAIRK